MAELEEDAWELFHAILLPLRFPPGSPGCASTAASATAPCSSPGRSTSWSPRSARCSTTSSAPAWASATAATPGGWPSCPPSARPAPISSTDYAADHGLSLAESVAYADSASDLAMLEAVGFPVAVNPEARLAAIARRRGWHVEHWDRASGRADRLLPLGALERRTLSGGSHR